jgi:hypothetical protein
LALGLFAGFPFVPSNRISRIDSAVAGINQTTYTLKANTAQSVGASIQANAVLYQQYLNGFSFPDNSHVTLSTAPPTGAQVVIPGQVGLTFTLCDQLSVPGQPFPANVGQTKFYLADDMTGPSNILNNKYIAVAGNPGIAIFFSNYATAAGAQLSWSQLACADSNGNALTYQASATILFTDNFQALSSLITNASSSLTSTTIAIASASANGNFYPGDYIVINPGGANQENVPVTAVNYINNTLTITGLNYAHLAGEQVFMNARPFYGQMTMPLGFLGGVAQTEINIVPVFDVMVVARA